jgi:hypothetical protein
MSSPKLLSLQKYSWSFFATTLLIALTTQSSLAFSLGPINVNPRDSEASYTLPDGRKGVTTWSALNLKIITQGGTIGFLERLRQDFKTWTFNSAPTDLAGSFRVQQYVAIGEPARVGARFRLEYEPGNGDPKPEDSELHWIQRVINNHNIRNNESGEHGINADIIDNKGREEDPYYDTTFGVQPFDEKTFRDFARRADPGNNHNWLAELYLVERTAPKQVTIYNGIQWGWENRVEPVPEPLTIFASGISLGFGVLFKKTFKEREKQKSL